MEKNKEWHSLQDLVDESFSRSITWQIAGQAFLFNAVAVLSTTDPPVPRYYPSLLELIPIIGCLFGCFSLFSSFEVLFVNKTRRSNLLNDVHEAKSRACKHIVGARRAFKDKRKPLKTVLRLAVVVELLFVFLALLFVVAWVLLYIHLLMGYECTSMWRTTDNCTSDPEVGGMTVYIEDDVFASINTTLVALADILLRPTNTERTHGL